MAYIGDLIALSVAQNLAAAGVAPSTTDTGKPNMSSLSGFKPTRAMVFVNVTAIAGTTPSLAVSLEYSADDGATFAAPDTAQTFAAITTTKKTFAVFNLAWERFRLSYNLTGTTPTATVSASVILLP